MRIKNLFDETDDSRAVSPVIGVILMVAITVILAAVIGTFVLGLGEQVESTPTASLSFDGTANGTVTIEHRGGANISYDDLEIRGSAVNSATAFDTEGEYFSAGDVVEISSGLEAGRLSVVYVGGEDEAVLGTYEVEA